MTRLIKTNKCAKEAYNRNAEVSEHQTNLFLVWIAGWSAMVRLWGAIFTTFGRPPVNANDR